MILIVSEAYFSPLLDIDVAEMLLPRYYATFAAIFRHTLTILILRHCRYYYCLRYAHVLIISPTAALPFTRHYVDTAMPRLRCCLCCQRCACALRV